MLPDPWIAERIQRSHERDRNARIERTRLLRESGLVPGPSRLRRVTGGLLIRAGARLAGPASGDVEILLGRQSSPA